MDSELPIFNDDNRFWLIRAEGGKFFDDFVNNDYVGIKYNRITIKELNELQKNNPALSIDDIRNLIFFKYIDAVGKDEITVDDLKASSKSQLTVHAKQDYLFAFEMKIGDFVLIPAKYSYKFALGIIIGNPYDENISAIKELQNEFKNGDIAYVPSNYIKRRKIQWLSIIERKDLPKEIAWIMNMHQAVGNLDTEDPSKLFNLVTPFYKYKDKYYLRVYTTRGGELSMRDWSDLFSIIPEAYQENIDLRANVNSPGFFTFLTSNLDGILHIISVLGGIGGPIISYKFLEALVGKDNLKEKGVIEWAQDRWRKHKDNKVHNMKKNIEYKEEKEKYKKIKSKNKTSKDKIKKLGLSIKDVGKPIEKNKNKIIELDVKDDKDQKDKQNKPKDNEKHS